MNSLLLILTLIGPPNGGQNITPAHAAPSPAAQFQGQSPSQNPAVPIPAAGQTTQLPAPKVLGADGKTPADDGGIVVQTQGPLHEAYAQPIDQNPTPGAIVPKAPPPPVPELPPGEKPSGANVQWIPGYWGWDPEKKDFLWVSGLWRNLPPDRKWTQGYWNKAGDGWQWTSGYWGDGKQAKPQYLPQPPDSLEQGPSQPSPNENYFYIPGAWVLKDGRYVWRPGFWYPAQQDWVYVAPHYNYSPAGAIYIDGYWDYPLADRGQLYAPVVFNQPYWNDPGWYYQPNYGFGLGFGFGGPWNNLFVGAGFGHYYCGNFFAASRFRHGFSPWYAFGARHYDPLFSYYHWNNRNNPGWFNGLHNNYWNRLGNPGLRPPSTLGQANALAGRGGFSHGGVGPNRLGNGNGSARGNMFQMATARQLHQPSVQRAAAERGATPPTIASRPAGGPSTISSASAISGGSARIFNSGGASASNLSRGAVASATANQASFNANSRALNSAAASTGSVNRAPFNSQSFYSGPSRTAPTPLYQATRQQNQNLATISGGQTALNASMMRQNQSALNANMMRQSQAPLNANGMRMNQALSPGRGYSQLGTMGGVPMGGYGGTMGSRSGFSGYSPSMSAYSGRSMGASGYSGARMSAVPGGGMRTGGGGGGMRVGGGGGGGRGGGRR